VAHVRDGKLLQVVAALHASGGLANLLHGRQQKPDQDGDDGDDHKQFDESESRAKATHDSFLTCE
jgi:hypothetical protein